MKPRVAYLDLDGTLTRDGSMFHGAHGVTLAGARALMALHEARVSIVLASGRTTRQLRETARFLGASGAIAELGAVLVQDGRETRTYDMASWPGARSPHAHDITRALCAALPVEPHEPWASQRDHTILLRGPPGLEARLQETLADLDPTLTASDNGDIGNNRHAYHVLPQGISKEHAITRDLASRGLDPTEAVAFGDSPGDATMARAVGTFYWIGTPESHPPRIVGIPRKYADGLWDAVLLALGHDKKTASDAPNV